MKFKNKDVNEIRNDISRTIIIATIIIYVLSMIPVYSVEYSDLYSGNLPSNIFLNIIYFLGWIMYKSAKLLYYFFKNYFYIAIGLILIYIYIKKFIIFNSDEMYYEEKSDESDDIADEMYYREIIEDYSPAVLSYINDFQLDINDVVATLMSLELKGKIKINNNLEILDSNEEGLSLNERYVLKNIEENILKIDFSTFKKSVINDCLNSKLLNKKTDYSNKMTRRGIIYFIAIIICIYLLTCDFVYDMKIHFLISMFIMLTPILYLISMLFYRFMYLNDLYVRNEKSKLINRKVNGLRKFIENFLKMDEREYKHIHIWRQYLIYSVIIGNNKKIVDEVGKYIKLL